MANPTDPVVDEAIAKRDATRRQLGDLYLERDTLQDTLFDTAKADLHDMARVRLDEVRDRIPPTEALLETQVNGVTLAEKVRDERQRGEMRGEVGHDGNALPPEVPDHRGRVARLENLGEVIVEQQPVGETSVPTPYGPLNAPDSTSTLDPLIVTLLVYGGKLALDRGKEKLEDWQERRTLEPLARAAMGDAMQEQQLDELKSTNAELAEQRQMLVGEMAKQELDQPTREAYWKEQFDQEVSKARVVLDSQAPDREGLTLSTDQLQVLQAERHALASGVCEREAAREKVEPQVRLYAESGRATEAQLDGYRQKLRETDAPEIAERTAELHQQYFPDIQPPALDGPGRGGPGDSGPGDGGPGDSGPGGPDRDDR